MIRIVVISALALALAGCNAAVYGPRPTMDVYVLPPRHIAQERVYIPQPMPYYAPRVYTQQPMPRPYYAPPRRPRCATVWNRTPRGYVERQVCGNHIP